MAVAQGRVARPREQKPTRMAFTPGQLWKIRQCDIPRDQLFDPESTRPGGKLRGSSSGMIYKQILCPRPIPRILSHLSRRFKQLCLPVGSLSKVASQCGLSANKSENCTPYHVFASRSKVSKPSGLPPSVKAATASKRCWISIPFSRSTLQLRHLACGVDLIVEAESRGDGNPTVLGV